MKIAFILGAFPTLSETFILDQITRLIDMGHQVEIFATENPLEHKVHADVEKYHLFELTHYYPEMPNNRYKRQSKLIATILKKLVRHPICTSKAVLLYIRHHKDLPPRNFFWLLSFIGRNFDIYHSHFGPNGNSAIYLKEIGIPGKHLTAFHGYDVNNYPRKVGKDVYCRLFQKGDAFTTNTNFTKQMTVNLGCPQEKINILPEGLQIDKFTFHTRKVQPGDSINILTVGRLVEKKGYEFSYRALAQLIPRYQNIDYYIVGDGPLKSKLEVLAAELKISRHVNFMGPLPQNEVLEMYQKAHIFLLPSVTASNGDKEGQGLVLQEAQAVGLPVISTLHNGIPDGVLDNRSGFLVPERDVDALAERLEYLIEHSEKWGQMGRAGREFVEQNYDIKKLNQRLEQIYKDLIREK